jgi:GNAT superfamily N-acetyltransferase
VASSANSQIAKESPRPVCKGELAQLEEIAFTAFKEGRFYHERGLRDGAAQQIYSAWAKNGVNYADEVWVTGKEVVTGFLTLKRDERNKRLWIDLIAVAPHAQGSGLGSVLVARSFESARQLKGWTLGVKTEPENLGALRFYLRNGLELESFQLDYSWRCSCAGSARTR